MVCPYEVVHCKGSYYVHTLGTMDFSSIPPVKRFGKRVIDKPFRTLEDANRAVNNLMIKSKVIF